jgi:hypothetical protein
MRFGTNILGLSVAGVFLLSVLSCSFNTEVKEVPKYLPNEPIEKVEGTVEEVKRGTDAVAKFHDLLNQQKFDEIFSWLDSKSQLSQDAVAFDVRMNRIYRELGTVEKSDLQRQSVFKKSATKEIRLEYITKFGKENDQRPRYEIFYFELYPSGETKLLEYMNGIDNEKAY